MNKRFFRFNKVMYFFMLSTLSIVLGYCNKEFFLGDEFYFNNYGEQLSFNDINRLIQFQDRWGWVTFVLVPVFYLLKFIITAATLYVGVFFLDLKYSFKKIFQIAMIAEAIFLAPVILKTGWFAFIQPDFTLGDLSSFYPLSLQNVFIGDTIEPWLLYPLQVVNVFELGYWFVLAAGISMAFKEDFYKSLSLVVKSYGLGLLLWVTLMIFLTLNFS
jgi:hypothetical protein